ncbi:MAG: hypothetical protein HXS46_10640 [Theionarchaea archaeon]|nr:hypothetical protein [Theionarchaea archaeon]
MCSSQEEESPVREPIVWMGRPHFRKALFIEVKEYTIPDAWRHFYSV